MNVNECFTIGIAPKTKKNYSQIIKTKGKTMLIPSKQYLTYCNDCGWFIPKLDEPISTPVNIQCQFYMKTRGRVDLTNLLEAIDDILTKYGYIKDNDCTVVVGHDGSRVYYDKENPRTEITITDAIPTFIK